MSVYSMGMLCKLVLWHVCFQQQAEKRLSYLISRDSILLHTAAVFKVYSIA